MRFFRNPEIRRDLYLFGGAAAVLTALGFCFGPGCGWAALLGGAVFGGLHFGVTCRRYRRIARLSRDIDALLHGGSAIPFDRYAEGELSILQNEIQKMTLRLRETAEVLEKDKRFLMASIADISHQLRTPLTALNLIVSMLSADELSAGRRLELCRELKNLVSRIDWLVETLLKISRIDAGAIAFRPEPLEAARLIERAAAPLAASMEIRGQTLLTDAGNARLTADGAWTAEALGNILKNCMEHTPEGGTVTVRARETALFTEITVRDTGAGIAREDLPHLFERFYKGKNAARGSFGIGLALAHTIVTAQNGVIRAGNTPEGAEFTVRFHKQII